MIETKFKLKPPVSIRLNGRHPLARGLVGCWLMNEGSGNKVYDLSGNRNNGTITNATWKPGKFGSCLNFDGDGDYVNYGNVLNIRLSSGWSFGCWFRTNWTAANQFKSIITKSRADTQIGRYYTVFEGGNLYTTLVTSAGAKTVSVSETPYLDGKWHFAVTSINRMGNLVFYLNGVSVGSISVSGDSSTDYNTTDILGIGAYQDSTGTSFTQGWFNGQIDNAMIFNRALSASEIAQLYREPFAMFSKKRFPALGVLDTGTVVSSSGKVFAIPSCSAGTLLLNQYLLGKVLGLSKVSGDIERHWWWGPSGKVSGITLAKGDIYIIIRNISGKLFAQAEVYGDLTKANLVVSLDGKIEGRSKLLADLNIAYGLRQFINIINDASISAQQHFAHDTSLSLLIGQDLEVQGTSTLFTPRFGTMAAITGVGFAGYLTILDQSGIPRKIAVVITV